VTEAGGEFLFLSFDADFRVLRTRWLQLSANPAFAVQIELMRPQCQPPASKAQQQRA